MSEEFLVDSQWTIWNRLGSSWRLALALHMPRAWLACAGGSFSPEKSTKIRDFFKLWPWH